MIELSFATLRDNGTYDAWNPPSTGNYAEDCRIGRRCFEEVKQLLDKAENPLLVVWIMQAMIEKGRVSGVETGFIQAAFASEK